MAKPDAALADAATGHPTETRSSLFVASTEKAFQVLAAFDGSHRHMTLADIARAAQLDRSATQRLVYTLETLGYLRRIPTTRNYGLTSKVLELSFNYLRANELIDKASPYLLEISRTIGETTNMQEMDGSNIVFVARFHGRHMVNVDFAVGARLPAFFTSSGTSLLSRMTLAQRLEILKATRLEPMTPFTETDPVRLMARVQRAAEQGYSVLGNETVVGDISVSAPIVDAHGAPVAAINISVPTNRWTMEQAEKELVPHIQVAAMSISKSKLTGHA
jgi:DNA-binding IclR family transcriptional regulator